MQDRGCFVPPLGTAPSLLHAKAPSETREKMSQIVRNGAIAEAAAIKQQLS